MTDEWAEGYVRRRAPRPAPFKRYTDHDEMVSWIEQQGTFQGVTSITAPLHRQEPIERWYANGQWFDLSPGQYVVREGFSFRVYDPDQMERFFELTEEDE